MVLWCVDKFWGEFPNEKNQVIKLKDFFLDTEAQEVYRSSGCRGITGIHRVWGQEDWRNHITMTVWFDQLNLFQAKLSRAPHFVPIPNNALFLSRGNDVKIIPIDLHQVGFPPLPIWVSFNEALNVTRQNSRVLSETHSRKINLFN